MSNNKQVAKNMIFSIISFAINMGISFFFTPYLIRTVGTEAYGFFPLTNNLIGYTYIVTSAIGSMAGRFIINEFYGGTLEKAKIYYNTVIVANLCLSAIFTLLAVVGVVYLDRFLNIPPDLIFDVKCLFALTFFCLIVSLPTGILSVGLSVKNVNHLSAASSVTGNSVRIGLMLILFWLFKPTIIYIGIAGVAAMLVSLCYGFYFKNKFLPEISFKPFKYFDIKAVWTLISSGIWNSINQLSNVLLQNLDLLITNIFISAAATGEYALVKTMPGLIYTILAMMSGAFYPIFNILYAKGKHVELSHEILKSIRIMSTFMGIPIGLLCVYGENFFHLWVPSQNAHLLFMLSVLTLVPMIFGASVNPIFGIFTITNKLKVPSIVLLVVGLVQTGVVFILLKYTNLGIWTIPIVSGLLAGLRNLLFVPVYGAHCLGEKWYAFYPVVLRGCLGMCIVMVIAYGAKIFYEPDSWLKFFFSMATVGFIAFIANFYLIFRKEEQFYILSILKNKLHV